jgi:hypothetical protein
MKEDLKEIKTNKKLQMKKINEVVLTAQTLEVIEVTDQRAENQINHGRVALRKIIIKQMST